MEQKTFAEIFEATKIFNDSPITYPSFYDI